MLGADQFRQRLLKQVASRGIFTFWPHQKTTEICKKSGGYYPVMGNHKRWHGNLLQRIIELRVVQDGLDMPDRQNSTRLSTENEEVRNSFTAILIHSCCWKKQQPALGQNSISRVGQYSISADNDRHDQGIKNMRANEFIVYLAETIKQTDRPRRPIAGR